MKTLPVPFRVRGAQRVRPDLTGDEDFAADYADAFTVETGPRMSASEWATACLSGAGAGRGAFATLVWHGLLGFDLAPMGEPGTLVGWRIRSDGEDLFELETDGRLMAGRMRFEVTSTEVTWTTMLRFHRAAAGRIWAAAGPVHRALAPRLLSRASGRR